MVRRVFSRRRTAKVRAAGLALTLGGVIALPLVSLLDAHPAYAAANAVIPTSPSAGTSSDVINNYQEVSFPANDDGTWPCGGDGNASPPCPGPDGETGPTPYPIGFNINFFGTEFNSLYINTNGNATFDEPLPQFTPSEIQDFGSPILAPFFADVDTRGTGSALVNFGTGTLDGQKVFVINWPGVGCYDEIASVLDNFQMILIDRPDLGTSALGDDFQLEYNYDSIQWDTGQASGGDTSCSNSSGDGTPAYVGYGDGSDTPGDFYQLPGSGVGDSFLDSSTTTGLIYNDLNSNVLGRYIFNVEGGVPPAQTSLTTNLSGDDQEPGPQISVPGATPVTDTATLSGNDATAGGTVTYNVYSDAGCTDEVSEGTPETITNTNGVVTVPPSAPVTLYSAGTYYWQAVYSGDATNFGASSTCGPNGEIETVTSTVLAPTMLTTSLSGGDQPGGTSISVRSGTAVSDTATLSGPESSNATGTVTYAVYNTSSCSGTPVSSNVQEITTPGEVPSSSSVTLDDPGVYYWKATYSGDSANEPADSACGPAAEGGEVETVTLAEPTTISTNLMWDDGEEGTTTTVESGTPVSDSVTLTGENADAATGSVTYDVYSNSDCSGSPVVTGAPQTITTPGEPPDSNTVTLTPAGKYYWQVSYSGDDSNDPSTSACGTEVETVTPAPTSVDTLLSGDDQDDVTIDVTGGTPVTDSASLDGRNASTATGTVTYNVYSDRDCTDLVSSGTPEEISDGTVPSSDPVTFYNEGDYYWQAVYSGDAANAVSSSTCGSEGEIEDVYTSVPAPTSIPSTALYYDDSGGTTTISVPGDTPVTDTAVLSGPDSATATGTVTYDVYSNCDDYPIYSGAPEEIAYPGELPESDPVTLAQVGTYYWVVVYSGDSTNAPSQTTCGPDSEVETVTSFPTYISTSLSGGGQSGQSVTVPGGTSVTDTATLDGEDADSASGTVTYDVYRNSCESLYITGPAEEITTPGVLPPSRPVTIDSAGTYFWKVSYSGDGSNSPSQSSCGDEGSEIETVNSSIASGPVVPPTNVSTSLSGGGRTGTSISVPEGTPVEDTAVLSGADAYVASGTVTYDLYSDPSCSTLASSGTPEAITTPGTLPASHPVTLDNPGTYYWEVLYSGDDLNTPSISTCGPSAEVETVTNANAPSSTTTTTTTSTTTATTTTTTSGGGGSPTNPPSSPSNGGQGNGQPGAPGAPTHLTSTSSGTPTNTNTSSSSNTSTNTGSNSGATSPATSSSSSQHAIAPVTSTNGLQLTPGSGIPGATLTAFGRGCHPGAPVTLTVDSRDVGTTSADSAGAYTASLVVPNLPVGQYTLVSKCAALTATTTLDVVLVTNAYPPTTVFVMLIFFVLIGIAIVRHQFA